MSRKIGQKNSTPEETPVNINGSRYKTGIGQNTPILCDY